MTFKAAIFDLDGVITDTAEFHYLAWKRLADELEISIDREFNEQLKGVSRMESLERVLVRGGRKEDWSIEEKIRLATEKNDYYKQLIDTITPSNLLPGIESLLMRLKEEGIRIGLASASKNAPDVIRKLGVGHYFDHIVDVGLVANGKPDPEIFLRAADALNTPYSDCLGVEDAEVGVEAIKAAGMFAVGVGKPDILAQADWVVENTGMLNYADLCKNYANRGHAAR
ncbi:beta-phosphoglucomutase [Paenibacillus sp. R14(2021)]|uniref:beta-phosphoglucomutase n=1 Tax=Paenibacillus sp. R14(2021) TaxID=2859228 RepID=UPI001C614434|nr:beta-phosphoglucomutase [Paenibacillus sp. R14(2021)]